MSHKVVTQSIKILSRFLRFYCSFKSLEQWSLFYFSSNPYNLVLREDLFLVQLYICKVFVNTCTTHLIKDEALRRAFVMTSSWAANDVLHAENININIISTVHYYHVTHVFQSESTLYSFLNVKELLAQNRRDLWILIDSNGIQTHNPLARKRTLNHLVKLAQFG